MMPRLICRGDARPTGVAVEKRGLVDALHFLYVRVVKTKEGSSNPYVEVKVGKYKLLTCHVEVKTDPEWNEVFAFAEERMESTLLECVVKDKASKDDFVGQVVLELKDAPRRDPSDGQLAPQWYLLKDRKGEKSKGELMLAVWIGTQADRVYGEAWHADAAAVPVEGLTNVRPKEYFSPKLWYLRVNVIEVQDFQSGHKGRSPQVSVKATLGNQYRMTKVWQNEDLMFVAAEPFDENLELSVEEDSTRPGKDESLGKTEISLRNVQKRLDYKDVSAKWYDLVKHASPEDGEKKKEKAKFARKIHLRVSLDGGYHVLDESAPYSSDPRPTAKELWRPSVGVLELGILSAQGLKPMKTKDGKGTTDAYCVAKYGQKWVKTRTIINSFEPKWHEKYHWEVFDPSTVVTVGVFDGWQLEVDKASGKRDTKIGKVRIRLSTLETNRIYRHSYPLYFLRSSGLEEMGHLQLSVRFSCPSLLDMLHVYALPLLPNMHYLRPLPLHQLNRLQHHATQIVSMRLSRAEPPLRKEVVEYMLDANSYMWSMRRSKANYHRVMGLITVLSDLSKWFDHMCRWKHPLLTILVHVVFFILVLSPKLILPTIFMYMFVIGIWRFRGRPRQPPHMDRQLSHVDHISSDEREEEFDPLPTSISSNDKLKLRYDRLRAVAAKVQTNIGDLATQGERLQSLLSWRDPRATGLFLTFCFIAAIVFYVTPFQVMVVMVGLYVLRHPRFRHNNLPSMPRNFFKRLPAKTDFLL